MKAVCEACKKPVSLRDSFCGHCGSCFLNDYSKVRGTDPYDGLDVRGVVELLKAPSKVRNRKGRSRFNPDWENMLGDWAELAVKIRDLADRLGLKVSLGAAGAWFYGGIEQTWVDFIENSLESGYNHSDIIKQSDEWFSLYEELMTGLEELGVSVSKVRRRIDEGRKFVDPVRKEQSLYGASTYKGSMMKKIRVVSGESFFSAESKRTLADVMKVVGDSTVAEWVDDQDGGLSADEIVELDSDYWIVVRLWDEGQSSGGDSLFYVKDGVVKPAIVSVEGGYGLNVPAFVDSLSEEYSLSEFEEKLRKEAGEYDF